MQLDKLSQSDFNNIITNCRDIIRNDSLDVLRPIDELINKSDDMRLYNTSAIIEIINNGIKHGVELTIKSAFILGFMFRDQLQEKLNETK